MATTKQQVLELLWQAQQLIEAGNWTVDGIEGTDPEVSNTADEMAAYVATASEWVGYYMDGE